MAVISPAELVADVLTRLGPPGLAPAGVVVGPASDAMQQAGVVSVIAAGLPTIERYTPIQWMRCQCRCLAPTLDLADQISQKVFTELNQKVRVVGYQASTAERYLIHLMNVTAGPSMHYDSPETWETLLFAEIMIGNVPIQT